MENSYKSLWLDLQGMPSPPSPSNPAAGFFRLHANSTTGFFNVIDSSGNAVMPPATVAPGSNIDGGTY